ncbi:hypothetical protein ACPA9J_04060 [Pseudomonas aeruginosa]
MHSHGTLLPRGVGDGGDQLGGAERRISRVAMKSSSRSCGSRRPSPGAGLPPGGGAGFAVSAAGSPT